MTKGVTMRVIPLPRPAADDDRPATGVVLGDVVFVPDHGSRSKNLAAARECLTELARRGARVRVKSRL